MYVLQDRHLTMVLDVTTGSCCKKSKRTKPTPVWEMSSGKHIFLSAAHCNWHFNKDFLVAVQVVQCLCCPCPQLQQEQMPIHSDRFCQGVHLVKSYPRWVTHQHNQIIWFLQEKCSCAYHVPLHPLPQLNKPGYMLHDIWEIRFLPRGLWRGGAAGPVASWLY